MQQKNHSSISLLLFWKCFFRLPLWTLPTFLKIKKRLENKKKRKKTFFYIYGIHEFRIILTVQFSSVHVLWTRLYTPVPSHTYHALHVPTYVSGQCQQLWGNNRADSRHMTCQSVSATAHLLTSSTTKDHFVRVVLRTLAGDKTTRSSTLFRFSFRNERENVSVNFSAVRHCSNREVCTVLFDIRVTRSQVGAGHFPYRTIPLPIKSRRRTSPLPVIIP